MTDTCTACFVFYQRVIQALPIYCQQLFNSHWSMQLPLNCIEKVPFKTYNREVTSFAIPEWKGSLKEDNLSCLGIQKYLTSPNVYITKIQFNPLNPGQFTRRVYRLPGPIRDNVPVSVSVSVFWQRKFRHLLHFTYFHIYCSLTGIMYSSVSVSKSDFLIILLLYIVHNMKRVSVSSRTLSISAIFSTQICVSSTKTRQ